MYSNYSLGLFFYGSGFFADLDPDSGKKGRSRQKVPDPKHWFLGWCQLVVMVDGGLPKVMLSMVLQGLGSDPAAVGQVQPLQPRTAHGHHLHKCGSVAEPGHFGRSRFEGAAPA